MTGVFVASALVVALALLALVMHRRGGRAHASGPEAPGASLVTTRGDSPTYAVGPGPGDVVLVPFPNDTGHRRHEIIAATALRALPARASEAAEPGGPTMHAGR
jgi:hypothetical protein